MNVLILFDPRDLHEWMKTRDLVIAYGAAKAVIVACHILQLPTPIFFFLRLAHIRSNDSSAIKRRALIAKAEPAVARRTPR